MAMTWYLKHNDRPEEIKSYKENASLSYNISQMLDTKEVTILNIHSCELKDIDLDPTTGSWP